MYRQVWGGLIESLAKQDLPVELPRGGGANQLRFGLPDGRLILGYSPKNQMISAYTLIRGPDRPSLYSRLKKDAEELNNALGVPWEWIDDEDYGYGKYSYAYDHENAEGAGAAAEVVGTALRVFLDAFTDRRVTGTTDADGTFKYEAGGTVTFSVGGVVIGSGSPSGEGAEITPVDIVSGGTEDNQAVVNIARFLQTLDDDGDPTNGIGISKTASDAIKSAGKTIDFDVDATTFSEDASVLEVVQKVAEKTGLEVELVSETQAKSHLQDTVMQVKAKRGVSTPGIRLNKTKGATTEAGGTFEFTVWLNSAPSANAVFQLTSNDTTEGTVSPSQLTFTSGNWETKQTVTISGVDDSDTDGHTSYQISLDPSSSTDSSYSALSAKTVVVVNQDNDAGIKLYPKSGITSESGKTLTFKLKLLVAPSSSVTAALSVSDSTEASVSPSSLSFSTSNWNSAQTFTVTGVDDNLDDKHQPYTLTVGGFTSSDSNYSALANSEITLVNLDDGNDSVRPTDQAAPAGKITLNRGEAATRSRTVSVSLKAQDDLGVTGYFLSEQSSRPGTSNSGWVAVTPKPRFTKGGLFHTFSGSSDGIKTLYAWFKDAAGRVSATTSDNITIDTTPPSLSISSPSVAFTHNGPVRYAVNYTGTDQISLSSSDITVLRTGTVTYDNFTVTGSGNLKRTVTFWGLDEEGTLKFRVAAGTASDASGYFAPASGLSAPVEVSPNYVEVETGIVLSAAPAVLSLTALRVQESASCPDYDCLALTALVDDDGPFSALSASWAYTPTWANITGIRTFTDNVSITSASDNNTQGHFSVLLKGYQDSDSGEIKLTVTDGGGSQGVLSLPLAPNAYPLISECDISGADCVVPHPPVKVASVSSTNPNGTYGIGDNLALSIRFSEQVTVS